MKDQKFIDNIDGNTLSKALSQILEEKSSDFSELKIATAYFSSAGFAQISESISSVSKVKLLLGAELNSIGIQEEKKFGESQDSFEKRRLAIGLECMSRNIRIERDNIPFNYTSNSSIKALVQLLRAGNIESRRYEIEFLHAKAYIFKFVEKSKTGFKGIIAGSSNMTKAGLTKNLELNLGSCNQNTFKRADDWFENLWEKAELYDIASIFEEVFQPKKPWEIFLFVLWQLYGREIEDDDRIDSELPLTNFQNHGVARAMRLLRDVGGVVVADEVGLGKTFIAGEILRHYQNQRQRVLVVCPASLRDTTWKKFSSQYQLFVECLSFEELSNDTQLNKKHAINAREHLQRPLDEYQLIIIDEAHNYRNPKAKTRAGVLKCLLSGKHRDLLLLTATPVNNSLWDLYHLLSFFLRQDTCLANKGIRSIRALFDDATIEDPKNLSPDILYPIIDATTVKRTRKFVKDHYSGDVIIDTDGKEKPIRFPRPHAISVRYKLDNLFPGLFNRLERALDPESIQKLKFARYTPNLWLKTKENSTEQSYAFTLEGLLRTSLLKRFESSIYAFKETVVRMVTEHNNFLKALDSGFVVNTAFIKEIEISADDEGIFERMLESTENKEYANLYKVNGLRKAVENDRNVLNELAEYASRIPSASDPKLKKLVEELIKVVNQAKLEAVDRVDEAQKRKVIIFTYFEDTVKWISDYLESAVKSQQKLLHYKNRMIAVSGSGNLATVSKEEAIQGFAPISMEAPAGKDGDLYDLMISTDVIAEGVNLQQCQHIINFDMPWNPMRLVQRHGRIDRIGSTHHDVYMRTFFPEDRLDQLLKLEERILNKIALAAATIGVATPVEGGGTNGSQVFSETPEEIKKLLEGNASLFERGGTISSTQTGEEYRQTLRKAVKEGKIDLISTPWKVGSGMVAGSERGIFFCCVVGSKTPFERTFLRFVFANDNWKCDDKNIEREIGTCLRKIECEENTKTWFPGILQSNVYDFWDVAQRDVWETWMKETDPANLQPHLRPINHRVANFIRENKPINLEDKNIIKALDILESPWPPREAAMLREWFNSNHSSIQSKSVYLIKKVLDTGLEPFEPPPVLPTIDVEEVKLLCWMGVEKI